MSSARQTHSIRGQSCTRLDPAVLNMNESARHCGVSDTTIRRLVEASVLPMKQVAPWAPWEILRSDLESEPYPPPHSGPAPGGSMRRSPES